MHITGVMAIIAIPVVVCILGALVYALSANAKVCELGRIMFMVGLFIALWLVGGERVRLP